MRLSSDFFHLQKTEHLFFLRTEENSMDSTTQARIKSQLIAEIDEMPPLLQQVAKYISDNPSDFGLDTIRKSADKIGVSPNTLVRMAAYLGFDSFDALREPFRQSLIIAADKGVDPDWIANYRAKDELGREHANALRNEVNIVDRSLHLLTPETLRSIVRNLVGADNVYVTATRSTYSLAFYFQYIGRMAISNMQLVPRHMGNAIEDMAELSKGDVLFAVTFRPYSAETIEAMRFANARGAKVVLMTDSELVAPNIEITDLLRVTTQSTHFFGCYAGAMAVLDCLLSHLVNAGGESATSRISKYENMRQNSGAYWRPTLPKVRK
ncbi:MurR/RpiR family transcriptional regulator [Tateyamaria sp.]|uniref:MurR/RpiR family transcriptional regulator n=1 Tax=Tateyamaria sp. TaxID=1929288 RepID=UPI00329D40C1